MTHEERPAIVREEKNNPLLTPAEVAVIFRVHPQTVVRWGRAGRIPVTVTPGGHHRFRRSDVLDVLLGGKNAAEAE